MTYPQSYGTNFANAAQQHGKQTSWYCKPEFCICLWSVICAAVIVGSIVALAHLPLHYRTSNNNITQSPRDSAPFLLIYAVNLTNVTDLVITDKLTLANRLMARYDLVGITIVTTQLASTTINNNEQQQFPQYNITQCQTGISTTNSILLILFIINYSSDCNTATCRQKFQENIRQRIMQFNDTSSLTFTLSDGRTFTMDTDLCSLIPNGSNLPISGILTTTSATTTTTDTPCTSTCTSDQVCVRGVCINVGNLGMALTWSRPGDADIVVTTPTNKTIFWRNKGPSVHTDEGFLDRDDRIATGPENIYWPTNSTRPPNGTYHVCMQIYAFTPLPSEETPLYATITVRWPPNTALTFTKIVTQRYASRNQCFPNTEAYLGSFRYS